MNLVIVNSTYETFTPAHSGAVATWVHQICQEAERDGVHPRVISRRSNYPQWDRPGTLWLDYPAIPQVPVKSHLARLQKRLMGWVRPRQEAWCAMVAQTIMREGMADWPLLLHNDMELAVSLRSRIPGATILHLAHNHNGSTPRYQRQFGRSVDVPLAVSDFTSRWNETCYQMPAGSIKTLYNGVDAETFAPLSRRPTASPVINYFGKLDRNKAPDVLLKACLRLAARTQKFSVQIIGRKLCDREESDTYTRELQEIGARLSQRGVTCRFPGWINRERLPQVLNAADINVTPSRWDEAFGLTTLEAMACGLAAVGSRTGGTPEVIGNAGFLFEREDDAALADILERLVCDDTLRAEYGRRARARAEQFSWVRTWSNLRSHIQKAVASAPASSVANGVHDIPCKPVPRQSS